MYVFRFNHLRTFWPLLLYIFNMKPAGFFSIIIAIITFIIGE